MMAPNACPPIMINLAFLTKKSCIIVENISVYSRTLLIYVPSLLKDFVKTYKMEKGAVSVMCERYLSKGQVS